MEDTTQPENNEVLAQVKSEHSEIEGNSDEELLEVEIDLQLLMHYKIPPRRSGRIREPTKRSIPNDLVALSICERLRS